MKTITINVFKHSNLSLVGSFTVQAYGECDAKHSAIRAAMAAGADWAKCGGLFAKVA